MDEAFEVLTLMQTGKARIVPIVLLDRPRGKYWETWMQFLTERLLKFGFISEEDFAFFKIKHRAAGRRRGDHAILQGLSLGALGGGALRHPP